MEESRMRDLLLKKYHALPKSYQKIIQVSALLFHAQHKTDIIGLIYNSDTITEDNKKLTQKTLRDIFAHLTQEKLLLQTFNCNPLLIHPVAQIAAEENMEWLRLIVIAIFKMPQYSSSNYEFFLRKLHIAILMNDVKFIQLISVGSKFYDCVNAMTQLFHTYTLDMYWVQSRKPIIQALLCYIKLNGYYIGAKSLPKDIDTWIAYYLNLAENVAAWNAIQDFPLLQSGLLHLNLCMGLLVPAQQRCAIVDSLHSMEVLGALEFFAKQSIKAIAAYTKAGKLFKTYIGHDIWASNNPHGILYFILLGLNDAKQALASKARLAKIHSDNLLFGVIDLIVSLQQYNYDKTQEIHEQIMHVFKPPADSISLWIVIFDWILFIIQPQKFNSKDRLRYLQDKFNHNYNYHNLLATHIYAEMIANIYPDDKASVEFLSKKTYGDFRFLDLIVIKQSWEYAIDQLSSVIVSQKDSMPMVEHQQHKRLAWFVDPQQLNIEIAEQKFQKKGGWSNGRAIALKRLYQNSDPTLDYLTDQDKKAILGLRREVAGWYNQEHYYWDTAQTIKLLIGHPVLFNMQNRLIPLELIQGTLVLQVEKKDRGYHLSLPYHRQKACIILEKDNVNRYQVIDFNEESVTISNILSERGLTVPQEAKDKVLSIVTHAKSNIHVCSDIEEDNIPVVESAAACWVHLFPLQEGLKINLWMRPFGLDGPYCRPCHGQNTLIATLQTDSGPVRKKTTRNFDAEKISLQALLENCNTLLELNEHGDEWHVDSVETCLEILHELDLYKNQQLLHIEWPKGQAFKLKKEINASSLTLSIKGSDYWFAYDGVVDIDNGTTLDMKKLLDLLDQDYGRFIKLADGEFVALTANFKKQLEDLRAISDSNKVYHLSTDILQGLADEAGHVKTNKQWQQHLTKIKSMAKYTPVIPSTLQANLREYQEIGFNYLSKLAHWEIGACLADDMGLGKTVQAIALLLEQAPLGPCLVVAPTSVCFIWLDEIAKFAPSLNAISLHNNIDNRENLIIKLGNLDILICSYTLLHQTGEFLIKKDWRVVILDEAQAIKNPETKRWQYAIQLQSSRRIALTGTPIENHLGEIWSLFRFLNPGLLGSRESFYRRFATPIEKDRNSIAKQALKNLVQPYILRRTKSEVLQELPSKTEQYIIIEPSKEETAFYEAVRVKALENIKNINIGNPGNKRFNILAEITRLRQACCNSSLVDDSIDIESGKTNTFLTLIKELIDNKHKTLVFSQFVRYLSKIKTVLEHEKIAYQYLDGSVKADARQQAVANFQAGKGEVFLISLKAGGTGLNLTAADYVIILDPWWNPAVEDQAASRAHRLGQQRPVTIYRLIMKNSIEEKIIDLHQNKRDLAADLLSGNDISGKFTEEELIQLITAN